jgi:hypothetical protein
MAGSDDDLVLRMSPLVRSSASTLSRNQPGQHQPTNLFFLHRIEFLFLNFCADLKPIEFGIGGGCGGKKESKFIERSPTCQVAVNDERLGVEDIQINFSFRGKKEKNGG